MLLKQQMQRSARATLQRQQHQHHTLCNSSAAIAAALLCCPRPNPWLVSPAAPSCLQQQQRQRWSGRCAAVAADKQQQHNAQQQRQAVDSGRICKPSPAPQQHQQQHTRASARQPSSLVVAAAAAAAVLPPPLPPPQPEQQHIISGVPATDAPNLDHHQQQPPVAALQGLPALPPSVLQHSHQQPHRFAHLSSISHVDPSALSITDRVQLLTSNAAARRHCPPKPRASLAGIKVDDVSQFCAAAGVSTAASAVVLQHVKASKLSASPGGLGYFLACYQQLSRMYGEAVVLQWLKKAPPVIRVADEVREAALRDCWGLVLLCVGSRSSSSVTSCRHACKAALVVKQDSDGHSQATFTCLCGLPTIVFVSLRTSLFVYVFVCPVHTHAHRSLGGWRSFSSCWAPAQACLTCWPSPSAALRCCRSAGLCW